jgi:hypothetical protein
MKLTKDAYHEHLEKDRVTTMINYIFYQAVCPIAAVAADFSRRAIVCKHVCLEGKK